MTTNPTRFAVSETASDALDMIATWQSGYQLDIPADMPLPKAAFEWPTIEGMTRMVSEGKDLFNLIRLAWEAKILTGPAEPYFNYEWDEDGGSAIYSVRLGAYPARVNLTTGALGWNETADIDAIGVAWALSALHAAAMQLNATLVEFENYLATTGPAPTLAAVA